MSDFCELGRDVEKSRYWLVVEGTETKLQDDFSLDTLAQAKQSGSIGFCLMFKETEYSAFDIIRKYRRVTRTIAVI